MSDDLELPTKDSPEVSIASSILPYNYDDDKARYLGLRSSGFSIREALHYIGKAHSTLSLWRKDGEFVALEERIPEFRHTLALDYANLEFLRNYRLVLEKDFRVLTLSLHPDINSETRKPIPMDSQDYGYLLKMRSHYTPQQLQIIETLVGIGEAAGQFDFTKAVLEISRTESVKITTRDRSGTAELARLKITEED